MVYRLLTTFLGRHFVAFMERHGFTIVATDHLAALRDGNNHVRLMATLFDSRAQFCEAPCPAHRAEERAYWRGRAEAYRVAADNLRRI